MTRRMAVAAVASLVPALARLSGAVLLLLAAHQTSAQEAGACLECHALPEQELSFRNGDTRSITLDPKAWEASAHGEAGLDCNACHTEHGEYPHAEIKDAGSREYAVARTGACVTCHEAIFEQYQASAHGAALLGEGNPDVPTCIDCHGVHQIPDPRTARFRVNSPKICAGCHTDSASMARYGLSTSVLKTYVADFHGSTVTLFQKTRPDQATNKPVCYDCHGVHDIPHTDDPEKGIKTKANLLRTCQHCHPDATVNFPDSWMSHFVPDRERSPLVFWVGWFYRILIPVTLGGMLLFVGADFARRRVDRRREARAKEPAGAEPGGETPS